MLSAAGFRAGNLINKRNIEIGGQVLPLKRTNLIPATLQQKEKEREGMIEKERIKEKVKEKEKEEEREREKVFPSLRDSESSNRSVRAYETEACSSTRKSRYFNLCLFIFFPLSLSHMVFVYLSICRIKSVLSDRDEIYL